MLAGGIAVPTEPSRQEEREGSEEEHPDSLSTALADSMVSQSHSWLLTIVYVYIYSAADAWLLLKQVPNSLHDFLHGKLASWDFTLTQEMAECGCKPKQSTECCNTYNNAQR